MLHALFFCFPANWQILFRDFLRNPEWGLVQRVSGSRRIPPHCACDDYDKIGGAGVSPPDFAQTWRHGHVELLLISQGTRRDRYFCLVSYYLFWKIKNELDGLKTGWRHQLVFILLQEAARIKQKRESCLLLLFFCGNELWWRLWRKVGLVH